MISEQFIYLALAINLAGATGYLIATLKGRTSPNRVTWSLWAAAPLIAFAAQIDEGVGLPALMTFAVGFGPLLIFLASFANRQAVWALTPFDVACGVFSLLALVLWAISGSATAAIVLAIVADLLAGIPTVRKAFIAPQTENPWVFWGALISAIITMLTLDEFTLASLGFPLYIAAICVVLVALIQFKLGPRLTGRAAMPA